jgi:hypothetical protein
MWFALGSAFVGKWALLTEEEIVKHCFQKEKECSALI